MRDAADTYQRYLTTPWTWRYEPDGVELGWVLGRLGELSEQLGDTARARSAWSQLLQLYEGADPAMKPVIDSVRGRLRELDGR